MKPSQKLNDLGQSPWLDLIGRKLIHSGQLLRFAEEEGIRGVTANPAIFEKAIVESDEYDEQLGQLISQDKEPLRIYEAVAVTDVRAGCDALRPLFLLQEVVEVVVGPVRAAVLRKILHAGRVGKAFMLADDRSA